MNQSHDSLRLRTLLFPTDGSAWAERVFSQAVYYAGHYGAALHVLTVLESSTPGTAALAFARNRLLTLEAESAGVDLVQATVESASLTQGILDYAVLIDADLIVMATHGRTGLDHLLLGSVAEAVVRRAERPVLTVRPMGEHAGTRAERILVPVDFSIASRLALAHAAALARVHRAALDLVHFVEPVMLSAVTEGVVNWAYPTANQVEQARVALYDLSEEADLDGLSVRLHAGAGHAAVGLLGVATETGAGLIVMSTHGRTGVRRFFLGSVAEKVVQQASCPVFVVKPFGKSLLPVPADESAAAQREEDALPH